ncbi:hypothetical protein HK105_202938 [Polyrhizophydium stewartii]|uniref:Beta-galactosidase n=1 Tax=Polyrhizophydium stewartii TaxID=2732419 RepID=A0ABR4NDQ4_9FUNG|nr:hypothetical protein HK105_001825 [Polyrhizophydium stewartii]
MQTAAAAVVPLLALAGGWLWLSRGPPGPHAASAPRTPARSSLSLGAAVAVALVLSAALAAGWVWLRRRNLGSLDVSTSSVAYNHDAFGRVFTWDKHRFYVHGRPVVLVSGEFHYWRLPDRSRWENVLAQYKASGLNAVRIYFHWGFHSPAEGVYHFDGNRDIEYLLGLCEKLHLFVLAAPGPYICAETQGGGIPQWVVAKRNVRIRHSSATMFRTYDPEFSALSAQWLNAILPIFVRHQITTNPRGCILALQIENESFELFKSIPLGLSDDMRHLAKTARDAGISVPLFTNDGWEEGSFVARDDSQLVLGKPTFGIDLYGFDKYVVFCPTSAPLATIGGGAKDTSTWPEWSPADVTSALDRTEATVRQFGGGAAASPIFIPELQGGWFNHYTVPHTFDDVYSFYGEPYTRMILDSVVAQGSTAFSFYMFYGGTNWGTIGDPDVYTSYDYSACIREFGHLSGRGRQLRLAAAFVRSFSDLVSATEAECNSLRCSSLQINASLGGYLAARRRTTGLELVDFVFLRNFSPSKAATANITVTRPNREPVMLKSRLPYKHSFIALGNYTAPNGLRLMLATMPVHLRVRPSPETEVWIVQTDDVISGQLAFYGSVDVHGSLSPNTRREDDVTIISFQGHRGWAKIVPAGAADAKPLIVVALSGRDLYTMQPVFEDEYWRGHHANLESLGSASVGLPLAVLWGAYTARLDVAERKLHLEREQGDNAVYAISVDALGTLAGFGKVPDTDAYSGADVITRLALGEPTAASAVAAASLPVASQLADVGARLVDFESMPWMPLQMKPNSTTAPAADAIDFGFTSGHVLYRISFNVERVPIAGLRLDINLRHRGTLYLNHFLLGGHITYSLGIFRPGSKNGPDVDIGAWQGYALPASLLRRGANQIVVVVESLGLNRQPFSLNDVRSPRGVIGAKISRVGGASALMSVFGINKPKALADREAATHEAILAEVDAAAKSASAESSDATRPAAKAAEPLAATGPEMERLASSVRWEIAGVDVRTLDCAFTHTGIPGEPDVADDGAFAPTSDADSELNPATGIHVFRAAPNGSAAPVWFRASFDLSPELQDAPVRAPLRLHMTGTGTAHVSINGVLIAKFYGNGDSPQKDFYVPEGLVRQRGNMLRLLVYGDGEKAHLLPTGRDWVGVEFRFWRINGTAGSLAQSSGNLDEAGPAFVLQQTTISV